MADVFLSYASADRDRAKALAEAIAAEGWSVWWDRAIPPGRVFDEVIEEALDAASCAVVLWSGASVASSWVRSEAAEAMRRRILVPVLIEPVKIPLEFRRLQAADLSAWRGTPSDPQFAELLRSIRALVSRGEGGEAGAAAAASAPAPRPRSERVPTSSAIERRPGAWRQSKAVVAALVVGAVVLLAAAYVVYDATDRRIAAEQEARRQAEESAAEAVRREAAQRQAEEDRRAEEAAAARREAAQRQAEEERRAEEAAAARARAAPTPRPQTAAPPPIVIRGAWRDTTWGHTSEFIQSGDTFQYTASGIACRGSFRSSGAGSIRGTRVEFTYQSTMPSEGRCTGTVSPDGSRMTSTCVDSVCGQFVAYLVRQ